MFSHLALSHAAKIGQLNDRALRDRQARKRRSYPARLDAYPGKLTGVEIGIRQTELENGLISRLGFTSGAPEHIHRPIASHTVEPGRAKGPISGR